MGSIMPSGGRRKKRISRLCEQALTDPQLKVVEGVLVDLLDALVEGDGEVGQGTQMAPFIFTLLREEEEHMSEGRVRVRLSGEAQPMMWECSECSDVGRLK